MHQPPSQRTRVDHKLAGRVAQAQLLLVEELAQPLQGNDLRDDEVRGGRL